MGQTVLGVLIAVVILTVIVVMHEAAHAGVARLCGMRVTELFVGLPFGPRASWRSRRTGVRYGATLALLGGYTRIGGMAYESDARLPLALAVVNARGRLSGEELAQVLGCQADDADVLMEQLADLGSVEPADPRARRSLGASRTWLAPARDPRGLTLADRGHDMSLPGSTRAGEPFAPAEGADAFFAAEVSRTYAGKGFWRRSAVLLAGVAANLLCAVALVAAYLAFFGVPGVSSGVAEVVDGSPAAQAGMRAGDEIVAVNGEAVSGYEEFSAAFRQVAAPGATVSVTYRRDGQDHDVTATLGDDAKLGVAYGYVQRRVPLGPAVVAAGAYALETGRALLGLFVPTQAAEVVSQSSGIVGVVAVTGQVAEQGPWELVMLMASLSLSLGWLNLVPIPPLDGGKFLFEAIGAVMRRPVPLRVQSAVSLVGMGLFLLLFFVMLNQDVSRLVTGGM